MANGMRRGRPSIDLEPEKRAILLDILARPEITVGILAKKIRIGYKQLYYPVMGPGRCSLETYHKITRWLVRNGLIAEESLAKRA